MNDNRSTVDHSLPPSALQRIDAICGRFEDAWQAGQRPRIDDYLGEAEEPERDHLLRELIGLDIDYRRQLGEKPEAHDYREHASSLDVRWLERLTEASRYELAGQIGRGGMGEVRQGYDRHLRRDLAVKMLRPELQDQPHLVRRFLREAWIGARLQHPGIVPVYELGEFPDRQPYFTMKLVRGHTLAALLKERGNPAEELPRLLTIFEQVCQTVAYAHAQGVIHRDLKPANIMVGAFGEVQVMDWGLAKVLDWAWGDRTVAGRDASASARAMESTDPGLKTQAGQAMGTYAYMPPEQARGEVDRLDERSDVFGLGAILCEILTGLPPFTGSDGKDVFAKARACDRADAMARLDGCGADSKLLRLAKACLAAERGDRPRNAGTVAKEVKAYLAGVQERLQAVERERAAAQARAEEARKTAEAEQARAEEARKVAMAEQARAEEEKKRATAERQARRRTVWAALAVLLVLVAGTVVSTMFAFYAWDQEYVAKGKAEDANRAEKEKSKALEVVEKTLVASLLRPLGQKEGPLDPIEAEALMTLSNLSNDSIHVRFIEEGLRSAETARRLNRRAEWVIQAAVGLDASRRHQVEEVLMGRLRQREAPDEVKEACVSLGIALEAQDPAFEELAAEPIVAATVRHINQNDLNGLPARLREFSGRLDASGASKVADALVAAMSKTSDRWDLGPLSEALQAVSERLDASGASKAADALIVAMSKTPHLYDALGFLSEGLQAVSGRLDASGASKAADALIVAMSKTPHLYALRFLSEGLQAVSERLEGAAATAQASKAANLLVAAMSKTTDPDDLDDLNRGLQAVSRRLDAPGASKAADLLVSAMSKTTNLFAFYKLSEGLLAVSGRLDASGANKAADAFMAVMTKTTDLDDLGYLSEGLQAVSERLEGAAATAQASKAANLLVAAMIANTVHVGHDRAPLIDQKLVSGDSLLAPALQAMSRRLDTSGVSKIADALVEAMRTATNAHGLYLLSQGLQGVSGRLDASAASKVADALVAAMRRTTDPHALNWLSKALQAVSGRLDTSGASKAADLLVAAMSNTTHPDALVPLSQGLQAVSRRLEDPVATAQASKAADLLVAAMNKTTDPDDLSQLSKALQAVSERLDASAASKAADLLVAAMRVAAMKKFDNESHLNSLSQALQAVSGRLDDATAAAQASKAADLLVAAMSKAPYPAGLHELSEGLQAVSRRLDDAAAAAQASKAANILAAAMSKPTAPHTLGSLSLGLQAVSERLDASGASKVAETLVATMNKTSELQDLYRLAAAQDTGSGQNFIEEADLHALYYWLSKALRAVCGRLDASGASKVAYAFMVTMSKVRVGPSGPRNLPGVTSSDIVRSLRSVMSTLCERWSTPDLLTLLRHPLAAGEAQRALLDVLGHRNRRTFRNTWHFLDWAHSNGVDLIPHEPLDDVEP